MVVDCGDTEYMKKWAARLSPGSEEMFRCRKQFNYRAMPRLSRNCMFGFGFVEIILIVSVFGT